MEDHKQSSGDATITRIEKQAKRRQRYNIYVDGEYRFSVHEDVLIRHHLTKGMTLDQQRLQYIAKDEENHQAYLQAIRFLSRRARSSKELEQKLLEKEYDIKTIEQVMEKLVKHGYLDDAHYAKMLAEQRSQSGGKGRRWIRQELSAKGLSEAHIEAAIAHIDDDTEFKHAYALALKRWGRQSDDEHIARKRKVNNFLLRRGYSYEIVRQVLDKLTDDEHHVN